MSRESRLVELAQAVAQAINTRPVYVPATAQAISYDPTASGLTGTNVKLALDELAVLAAVQSVNGKTGTPVLTAVDVGADPTGTAAAALTAHVTGPDPHQQYAPRNNTVLTGYTKISTLTIGNDSVYLYLPGTPGTLGLRTGVSGSERYFMFHADGRLEVANGGLSAAGMITGQIFMSDYTDSGAHRGLYRTGGNENRGFYDDGTDYRVGAGTPETGVWKKIWHEGNFDPATKQAALGYTPVRQGGGIGQLGNNILIGWSGSKIKIQVDNTDFGALATESWANDNLVKLNGDQTIAGKLTTAGIAANNTTGTGAWAYEILYSGTGIAGIWNDGSSIWLMNINGGWNRSSIMLKADGGVVFHGSLVGFDSPVAITTAGSNTSFKITDTTNGGNLWLVGAGTNPNKPIRVSNTGDLEFLNSAYSAVVARISDAGSVMSLGGFSPRGSIGLDYLPGGTRLMIRADGSNATIDAVNNANSVFDVLHLRGTDLRFNAQTVWHAGNFNPASMANLSGDNTYDGQARFVGSVEGKLYLRNSAATKGYYISAGPNNSLYFYDTGAPGTIYTYLNSTHSFSGNVVAGGTFYPNGAGAGYINAWDNGNYPRIGAGGNYGFESTGNPAGPADLQRASYLATGSFGGGYSMKDNAGQGVYYGGMWMASNYMYLGVTSPGSKAATSPVSINSAGALTASALTTTGNILGANLIAGGSGNGAYVQVGDDAKLIDVGVAHTVGIQSTTNANVGYIRFGGMSGYFGWDGSRLRTNGIFSVISPNGAYFEVTDGGSNYVRYGWNADMSVNGNGWAKIHNDNSASITVANANGASISGNGAGLQFNGNFYISSRPNVVNATANGWVTMPRIFVQAGDPGNAASDGDLWIW